MRENGPTLPIGRVLKGLDDLKNSTTDAYSMFVITEAKRYINQNYKLREVLRKYEYGDCKAKESKE